MFVFSVKTTKKQLLSAILCVVMLVAIIVVAVAWPTGDAEATGGSVYRPVSVKDESSMVQFLANLGYEVNPTYTEVREVLIPDEFDDVFTNYNALQKEAGMDLEPYHGKRMKCFSYKVTNYPGEPDALAHLYIYDGKIVGGDISSTALDGFMHGLSKIG